MKFYVMTLFPQMILDGLNTSITGRAIESGALCVEAVDIRDFSKNKHMKVDDYPYGDSAGAYIQPEYGRRVRKGRRTCYIMWTL